MQVLATKIRYHHRRRNSLSKKRCPLGFYSLRWPCLYGINRNKEPRNRYHPHCQRRQFKMQNFVNPVVANIHPATQCLVNFTLLCRALIDTRRANLPPNVKQPQWYPLNPYSGRSTNIYSSTHTTHSSVNASSMQNLHNCKTPLRAGTWLKHLLNCYKKPKRKG